MLLRIFVLAFTVAAITAFDCPTPDGLFAQPGDCRSFHHCTGGKSVLKPCPKGLFFDDWWKVCNWEDDAICGPLPPGFQGPTTTTYGPTGPPLCPVKGTVPCSSQTQCIEANQLCNGVRDCLDGSDEVYCPPQPDVRNAHVCNPGNCRLPTCYCNKEFNKALRPGLPQLILISTSGSINEAKYEKLADLYRAAYRNPNQCRIKGTHFLSHEYTNYHLVDVLSAAGMEIAIESVSQSVPQMEWQTAPQDVWQRELTGEKNILQKYSNIRPTGVRAPFLQTGGDDQFYAIQASGARYDASIQNNYFAEPSWPFTLDYKLPFERCTMYRCPNHVHAGLWEVPLNQLYSVRKRPCVVLDQCYNEGTAEGAFQFLLSNFNQHYNSNKAPFNLVLGDMWLNTTAHLSAGLHKFIQFITSNRQNFPDVWFATYNDLIDLLLGQGEIANHISGMPNQNCQQSPPACITPNTCVTQLRNNEKREMVTCKACPLYYPWSDNPAGDKESKIQRIP